jgi:probable phosphoglycerate mutase
MKSNSPLRLYLIRHGETEWSISRQHTGATYIPLTERGDAEAGELARRLRNIPFTCVLTSPLRRARRTCELAIPGVDREIEPDLVEWDYGDYEGLRSPEILRQRPGWNLFHDGGANGETPQEVSERADRLIARLRMLKGNVALFTHGHFGRVLAVRWIGLPVTAGQHFELGTASLSILSYDPHHAKVPVIAHWNANSPVCFQSEKIRAIERWENEGGEIPDPPRQLATDKMT